MRTSAKMWSTSVQRIFLVCLSLLVTGLLGMEFAFAQKADPHPWLASAPGEFVRLIDRGNVKIEIDDERIRNANKSALTLFQFTVKYDFRFRYEFVRDQVPTDGWKVKIIAWMDQPDIRLDHTICIQSSFQPQNPWQSRLVKHEFDHVAISTDPRLVSIIKRVLQRRRNWIAKWEQETAPTESEIRQRVQDEIDVEVKNCEQMIQRQYDALDAMSSDGIAPISNRKKFFQDLYSVAGLERTKFEYLDTLRSFVKDKLSTSAVESEVDKHYLFLSE